METKEKYYKEEENSDDEFEGDEIVQQRRPHKGGKIIRIEPTNLRELEASPLAVSCFRHVGCYEFCEKVERVQHHLELTRLFILNLHNNRVTLTCVTFALSTAIIDDATGIPNVGERWYKSHDLDDHYFEPYLKTRYKN